VAAQLSGLNAALERAFILTESVVGLPSCCPRICPQRPLFDICGLRNLLSSSSRPTGKLDDSWAPMFSNFAVSLVFDGFDLNEWQKWKLRADERQLQALRSTQ
jgi:hypothetical protein